MRKLFVILGLIVSLNSFGQLGKSYHETFDFVNNDPQLINIKTDNSKDGDYLIYSEKTDGSVISIGYYFKNKDTLCYLKKVFCNSNILNDIITKFNTDYVKLSELQWKDYATNSMYTITIYNDMAIFVIDVY